MQLPHPATIAPFIVEHLIVLHLPLPINENEVTEPLIRFSQPAPIKE
eukprot:UN01878